MEVNTWTDAELEAAAVGYLRMLQMQGAGRPFVKSQIVNALLAGPLSARKSIDHRMQNFSALLAEHGEPWVKGYAPLPNIGSAKQRARILAILEKVRGVPLAAVVPKAQPAIHVGAPEPSHSVRQGVMHMRRAPAATYLFSLARASTPACKIGWAFDWRHRLRDFNRASMPGVGGILYQYEHHTVWPQAKAAFRTEQGVLAYFARARHPGNQEIIVGVPIPEIIDAWNLVVADVVSRP